MQPQLALLCIFVTLQQLVFVPLIQLAINRRVQSRITVLRRVSAGVLRERSADRTGRTGKSCGSPRSSN